MFSIGLRIVSWSWTLNFNVLFPEPLSYHFGLMVWYSIILAKALLFTKLFLGGWKKLLLQDVLVAFFIG